MMFARILRILTIAIALSAQSTSATQAQIETTTRPLTVVELFTSQGCSSCPPANINLATLARRENILALSFGVTYWDYLGWRDTFAAPAFTTRQHDYARHLRLTNVYTPQMVINGRVDTVGNRIGHLNRLIQNVPPLRAGPRITTTPSGLALSAMAGQTREATIWLIRYDPNVVQVPIRRGENGGKTLPHINVVRELTNLGTYTGSAQIVRLAPPLNPALKTAILVQNGVGGPLLFAAKLQ